MRGFNDAAGWSHCVLISLLMLSYTLHLYEPNVLNDYIYMLYYILVIRRSLSLLTLWFIEVTLGHSYRNSSELFFQRKKLYTLLHNPFSAAFCWWKAWPHSALLCIFSMLRETAPWVEALTTQCETWQRVSVFMGYLLYLRCFMWEWEDQSGSERDCVHIYFQQRQLWIMCFFTQDATDFSFCRIPHTLKTGLVSLPLNMSQSLKYWL